MLFVSMLYAIGICIGDALNPPLPLLFPVTIILSLAAFLAPSFRQHLLPPLLILTGSLAITLDNSTLCPADLRLHLTGDPVLATARGELLETPAQRSTVDGKPRWMVRVQVTGLHTNETWASASGVIIASTPGPMPPGLYKGQSVEITGVLQQPDGPVAPGLFDYKSYLRRHRIYFQLRASGAEDWRVLNPIRPPPTADRFIQWASAVFSLGLEEDLNVQLLRAMTLGQRNEITADVYEPFIKSGTMHVFAISGLHIAIMAGILLALLKVARVPREWCGLIVVPLIWSYTAATGWQPSAIRATIMMTVVVTGWALRRPGQILNSLAASGFLILAWDPQQLFQASFQLSFSVVLMIVIIVPRLDKLIYQHVKHDPFLPDDLLTSARQSGWVTLRAGTAYTATSFAAWLGAIPLTATYFNLFSIVTLFANLVVIPLSNLALACNFASLCCGTILPPCTELFNNAAWFFMQCMVALSNQAAEIGTFNVPAFTTIEVLGYYALLICISLRVWKRPGGLWGLYLGSAMLVMLFGGRLVVATFTDEVTILAKSGSAIVHVRSGLLHDSVIDPGRSNTVQFLTGPYLRAQGVNDLDALILTHGDMQHVEGAPWLSEEFHAESVYVSGLKFRSPSYGAAIASLRKNSKLVEIHAGQQVHGWQVLHPEPAANYSRADDGTLCLRRSIGKLRLLHLGDLGRDGQETLLNSGQDLKADILLIGLPSQGSAANDGLLDAIQPSIIIVADDTSPSYEKADEALIKRLSRRDVPLWCMSKEGTVTVRPRWRGVELSTASRKRVWLPH